MRWPSLREAGIVAGVLVAWPLLTEAIRLMVGASDFYGVPFALVAVIIAARQSGLAAGLVVAVASALALMMVLPESRVVDADTESVWHLLIFSLTATFVAWQESTSRRLDERLKREVEYKNAFLALMSHELRTPATMIYSGMRVLRLRGSQLTQQEIDDVIRGVEVESERLTDMVDDILLLSQIENGRGIYPNAISLMETLQATLEAFQRQHPERELQLRVDGGGDTVLGEERQLSAVLRHLLANANSYSPPEMPIIVSLELAGKEARVSVRDFGNGIQDGELKMIFAPYYRGRGLSAGSRGIGLGLTLCRSVVEAMGGRISAHSPAGGGLEVSFTLKRPLQPAREAAHATAN